MTIDEKANVLSVDGEAFDGPVIYTGMVDALFKMAYGALPYRSLRFDWQTCDRDSYQAAPVVAYPQAEGYTRITEYKKLPVQHVAGKTTVAVEYPLLYDGGKTTEPYYPIPTAENQQMYEKYLKRAKSISNPVFMWKIGAIQVLQHRSGHRSCPGRLWKAQQSAKIGEYCLFGLWRRD